MKQMPLNVFKGNQDSSHKTELAHIQYQYRRNCIDEYIYIYIHQCSFSYTEKNPHEKACGSNLCCLDEYISTSPFSSPNSISSARDLLLAAWRKMKSVPASFSELYHCQYVDLDSSLKPSEPVFSNLKITGKFMSILIQFKLELSLRLVVRSLCNMTKANHQSLLVSTL